MANKSLTLYDIAAEGQFITECLIDNEGELDPILEERLNALLVSGQDKMLAAGHVLANLETAQAACEMEARRLKARAQSYSIAIERLIARMTAALDSAFNGKLKLDTMTLWTQKAKDSVSFELAEEMTLEQLQTERPDFVRVKLELNKSAIQAAYDSEEPLPDSIFANKKVGARYLRWK